MAGRLADVIAEQERIFIDRQPESARLARCAPEVLAGGVTSSWQISRPQPVWLSHGAGSKVWDVDGNEYVDMHGGYGAVLAGHAHPAIVEAITRQARCGTHFAQPTKDALAVAGELARRFGLPLWRFANSGTEATMDAVHLMRAVTGRDLIIKVEGCYHGHHDSVQVSVWPEPRTRHRNAGRVRGEHAGALLACERVTATRGLIAPGDVTQPLQLRWRGATKRFPVPAANAASSRRRCTSFKSFGTAASWQRIGPTRSPGAKSGR